MTQKTLVNDVDVIEVRKVLKKFQEGYTNRNVEILGNYINDIFVPDDSMLTVGTSRSEWCLGLNDLKGLIESDWKYWGNLRVILWRRVFMGVQIRSFSNKRR